MTLMKQLAALTGGSPMLNRWAKSKICVKWVVMLSRPLLWYWLQTLILHVWTLATQTGRRGLFGWEGWRIGDKSAKERR